ncbi:MAG: integration host factor subunit beta [Duodenibacillus sp.]|nr:integration host factor subunit beta [Duodenibacillus sp.]
MTKSELIDRVFDRNCNLTSREAEVAVNEVLRTMVSAMARGVRVEVRGFGSFSLKYRAPRAGRNPRTGEAVQVPAKFAPHFRAGKELRDALNEAKARSESEADS